MNKKVSIVLLSCFLGTSALHGMNVNNIPAQAGQQPDAQPVPQLRPQTELGWKASLKSIWQAIKNNPGKSSAAGLALVGGAFALADYKGLLPESATKFITKAINTISNTMSKCVEKTREWFNTHPNVKAAAMVAPVAVNTASGFKNLFCNKQPSELSEQSQLRAPIQRQRQEAPSERQIFNATVFVKKLPRNMRQALASHKHRKHSEMIRAAKRSLSKSKKAAGLTDDQIVAIVKKSW